MGIFAEFAPQYAELGFVSIPVNRKKRAQVKGWKKFNVHSYRKFLSSHADANIALLDGTDGGLVRIDIDDSKLFDECLERFGQTPVIAATPSGGFHLFYRANGERRMLHIEGKKIDILGDGGYGLVPGSRTDAGTYRFIEGSLNDLGGHLPYMKDVPKFLPQAPGQMRTGDGRNKFLFNALRHEAQQYKDEVELIALANTLNNNFAEPLPSNEVHRVAGSVWRYLQEGRLWLRGCEASTLINKPMYDLLNEKELRLFIGLKLAHGAKRGDPFVLAQKAAETFGISIHSLRLAQAGLEAKGFIEVVQRGKLGEWKPTRVRLLK